jgi:hypothetical protein
MVHRTGLQSIRRQHRPASLLAAIAMTGLTAVAGCGQAAIDSASPPGTSRPVGAAQPALCADPAAVTRVQIVRIPSIGQLPASRIRKTFKITITDPARAQALARADCGLPRIPSGAIHCPVDYGGAYQLLFTAGQPLPVVTIQSGGCDTVTGAGPVRWVARTPGFWTVFGKLAGIRAVAHQP